MIEPQDFGPVRYYQVDRSIAGRHIISTGVYRIGDLLIDTGPPRCHSFIRQVLEDGPVRHLVLTHHHEDHIGNAALVAERCGSTPRIHPLGVPLVARAPTLPLYRRVVWGTPEPLRARELGEWVETDRYRFRVIHTPGHAVDHVALHEPDQDWLFCGDLYLGDRQRFAFGDEDVGALIGSLRALLAISDCQMYCQHSGFHRSHQQRLGRKLDFLLGLRDRAVVHFEEGQTLGEITRALGIHDRFYRFVSGGDWSGRNLVRGLLRDAGKIH